MPPEPNTIHAHDLIPGSLMTLYDHVIWNGHQFNGHWSWIYVARNDPTINGTHIWQWMADQRADRKGGAVDEEVFNMSVRRFLKKLGVTAQREIELAVREQLDDGALQGDETLDATATITIAGLSRDVVVTGEIALT